MERDCMVSHGASRFTRGRMYAASDKSWLKKQNKKQILYYHIKQKNKPHRA